VFITNVDMLGIMVYSIAFWRDPLGLAPYVQRSLRHVRHRASHALRLRERKPDRARTDPHPASPLFAPRHRAHPADPRAHHRPWHQPRRGQGDLLLDGSGGAEPAPDPGNRISRARRRPPSLGLSAAPPRPPFRA